MDGMLDGRSRRDDFRPGRGLFIEERACKIEIDEIIVINYPVPWHFTLSI